MDYYLHVVDVALQRMDLQPVGLDEKVQMERLHSALPVQLEPPELWTRD
jgi:hypothetical protein